MNEEMMKNISLEVVRERLLDHVHQVVITILFLSGLAKKFFFIQELCFYFQEIPYGIEHRLVDWKEFRDGSLRIEQHLITNKPSQRKILVGKNGCKIG